MEPSIIIETVGEKFHGEVIASGESLGQSWVSLRRDRLAEICYFLKTNPDIKMDYLIDVTAVDWLPRTPRFEVVYHMRSIKHGSSLRLKVPVEEDDPKVPTVSGVWLTANWHERETFDLMGIIFEGHPDPRRILMPDDWEGHPLRKDYPLGGYDWEFKPW